MPQTKRVAGSVTLVLGMLCVPALVLAISSFELLPGGCDLYLAFGLMSATGVAASVEFWSSSIKAGLLLGSMPAACVFGFVTAWTALFVDPGPDADYKWGNDLPAALFGGGFMAVISMTVGLCFSGLFLVCVRVAKSPIRPSDD